MRRHPSRLIVTIGAGAVLAAAAAGGLAASMLNNRVSAASRPQSRAVSFSDACGASSYGRLAATTGSGAQVFVGQGLTQGSYCLVYRDGNGTSVRTSGSIGGTPAGRALVLKALDTVSNEYVIVALVPDGFNSASIGASNVAVTNNVLVVPENRAPRSVEISGPSGRTAINLADFLG